jgi:flagellar biosynthesis protein FlhF
MAAAVQRLSDREIVLIDTGGRSPRDSAGLRELREILAAAQPDEVPLVLSCSGDQGAFDVAAREFRRAGATSLILTKVDEAWRLGQLPDWLAAGRLPLCYTTHGQNVPDDLEPASALGLAELVFPDR